MHYAAAVWADHFLSAVENARTSGPTFEDSREAYREHGLECQPVPGSPRGFRHMVCIPHDGVPYTVDHHGRVENAGDKVHKRDLLIMRHHAKIKAVWQHAQQRSDTPVWVMCGGGAQLQAFFGTTSGYLGILYLDLQDLEQHVRLAASGYLKAVGNEAYSLVVQSAPARKYFQGMRVPGIRTKLFGQA